jgi:hypothetical protein
MPCDRMRWHEPNTVGVKPGCERQAAFARAPAKLPFLQRSQCGEVLARSGREGREPSERKNWRGVATETHTANAYSRPKMYRTSMA